MNKNSIDARKDIIDLAYNNKVRVHFGASFSILEILFAIYGQVLNESKSEKFILSKGHASIAYYYILYKKGHISKEEFEGAYLDGQDLTGHPVMDDQKGIYFSTGSLGLGISIGIGDAISNKMLNNGKYTYVLIGDGELEEGNIWEAILFLAQNKLDNIIVILDNNKMQCDDFCKNIISLENKLEVFSKMGFETVEVDGHDTEKIANEIKRMKNVTGKPKIIIANTVKGKGISFMENRTDWHYKGINEDEYNMAMSEVNSLYNEI